MTAAAPVGVVTFLFTDVKGSARRWEADADAMRSALAVHAQRALKLRGRMGLAWVSPDPPMGWS